MNSRQSPNILLILSRTINEEDNARSVEKWLKSGELTPKLFKKHLRHTAKDISQGLRDGQNVAWSLMRSIWVGKSEEASLLRALSSALTTVVLPQSSSPTKRTHVGAILGNFLFYNMHRNDAEGSVIDVKSSLSDALKSIRSFVMTNDQWADELGEPTGQAYRSTAPVYKLSETEFVDAVYGELGKVNSTEELWLECEMMRRTANALSRLCENYNPIFYTCWECDKVVVDILHCGCCKAALYCSRECQAAAWKGGHKKKCDRLKETNEFVLENLEEVERVHVTGIQDGILLSPQTDSLVLQLCLGFIAKVDCSEYGDLQCSMKSFYENLGRISRGEWWVYDLSDEEKNEADISDKEKSHPEIRALLYLLTLDWFEHTRSELGADSVDPQQVTELTDPFFRRDGLAPISTDSLLAVYHAVDPGMSFRPHFKVSAHERLRLAYDLL